VKKSLGQMEAEFLDAMRSYYYDGQPSMTNEEFDNLKVRRPIRTRPRRRPWPPGSPPIGDSCSPRTPPGGSAAPGCPPQLAPARAHPAPTPPPPCAPPQEELLWEGSTVVVLSEIEQKFLEAAMAYNAGKPIMSDEEYDKLKKGERPPGEASWRAPRGRPRGVGSATPPLVSEGRPRFPLAGGPPPPPPRPAELKQQNSTVAAGGPRCSIRTGKMYSDASVDYTKMLALNIPAVFIVLGAVFATDLVSGFSLSRLIESPGLVGNLFLWTVLLPGIYVLSSSLTNLIIRDGVILTSKCANCGHTNNAYFGDIIIVEGAKGTQELECEACKSLLKWDNDSREVVVEREGPAVKA